MLQKIIKLISCFRIYRKDDKVLTTSDICNTLQHEWRGALRWRKRLPKMARRLALCKNIDAAKCGEDKENSNNQIQETKPSLLCTADFDNKNNNCELWYAVGHYSQWL
jgi:hypothetical protein